MRVQAIDRGQKLVECSDNVVVAPEQQVHALRCNARGYDLGVEIFHDLQETVVG